MHDDERIIPRIPRPRRSPENPPAPVPKQLPRRAEGAV